MCKSGVFLPCAEPHFISSEDNMFADAAMSACCASAPDMLLHKCFGCSFSENEKNQEKRFSISIADPWCEGSASKYTTSEKMVFEKETYRAMGTDMVQVLKGYLEAGAYITVCAVIPYCEGKPEEKKCLITGYDSELCEFQIFYKGHSVNLNSFRLKFKNVDDFLFGTKANNILFLSWIFNEKALFYQPSAAKLVFEFNDYVHSENHRYQYRNASLYGLNAMHRLKAEWQIMMEAGEAIPEVYSSQYIYHKKKMAERLKRLIEVQMISGEYSDLILAEEQVVAFMGEWLQEYNQSHEGGVQNKVLTLMDEVESLERRFLPDMMEQLLVLAPDALKGLS